MKLRRTALERGLLNREDTARREAEFSIAVRDIGELPPVKHPRRRSRCKKNFRSFCEKYFPNTFTLGWYDS
jgi:hypothetical protein